MIKNYINLTKPGIVKGNAIVAFGGFMLASNGNINLSDLFFCLVGLSLIIAAGCVFNNYIDIEIDKKMSRTKNRELVTNTISRKNALVYGFILLSLGLLAIMQTNFLATSIALFGFFAYVVVYGFFKRRSIYGTEAGSISGATPPVVGYVAATGSLDRAALLLFLIMVVWQMPHFFAIAIRRAKDYKSANLPIITVKKGVYKTKIRSLFYIGLFCLISPLLSIYGYTGTVYQIFISVLGLYWLLLGWWGIKRYGDKLWASKIFSTSLIMLLVFSLLISLNAWLP